MQDWHLISISSPGQDESSQVPVEHPSYLNMMEVPR